MFISHDEVYPIGDLVAGVRRACLLAFCMAFIWFKAEGRWCLAVFLIAYIASSSPRQSHCTAELPWSVGNPVNKSVLPDDQDVHTCISLAADSIGLNYTPTYEVSTGKPCDWVANIQETFHPIEITDGLWIIPKWRTPPDLQAVNIILDPGLAFGTGEHPTTKLCLLLLHSLIKGGEHFFDYGTGSGVLGIAAMKMGAALSIGIDIDPQAVTSACQNMVLNEIDANKMWIYLVSSKVCSPNIHERTDKNPEEQTSENLELIAAKQNFDIVIANILLNPLMDLAEDIVSFAKPGAVVGLSGILSEQVQQIKELYAQYLENISLTEMDGWACLHGTRKRF